jgi:isopentenyl-diphosphate delta-isomerase
MVHAGGDGPLSAGFEDARFIHCSLPELAWEQVTVEADLLGRTLAVPIVIEAMTGGHPEVQPIVAGLARVARAVGAAMAVGSQRAALEDPALAETFAVARRENPGGMVIANVGAEVDPQGAARAVAMIGADLLQVHLNVAHELAMAEGERDFRGRLHNLREVIRTVQVPVMVKETGAGLSRETALLVTELGAAAVDIGGAGGTNFAAVECERGGKDVARGLVSWGIPTLASLVEVADAVGHRVQVVASGGLRSGHDAAKALALGASAVGLAGPIVRALLTSGEAAAVDLIRGMVEQLKAVMLLTGSRDLGELRGKPVILCGPTAEWLTRRGVDVDRLAGR